MPECIILVGPPGSGKSTLAQEYVSKGYCRISQDDQGKKEHLDIFKHDAFIGENIVLDRMNFNKEQRKRYIDILKEAQYKNFGNDYKIKIIVLHENMETCLKRMGDRQNHPTIKTEEQGRSALKTFFTKYERPTPDEADEIEFRYPTNEKKDAIICDLDGTLCNLDHRLHHVNPPEGKKANWRAFFSEMRQDSCNDWCRQILYKFKETHQIVFASGRPKDYFTPTHNWLCAELPDLVHSYLYMRLEGDYRKDDIVKENILDFEILTRFKPLFVIDDRDQVVAMWRKRGIVCLQCNYGDF